MPGAVLRTAAAVLCAIWLQCPSAAPQSIVEFPAAAAPGPMVAGPDGYLYFSGGRISTSGEYAAYGPGPQDCGTSRRGLPMQASVVRTLAFGSDGNLWFTMDCTEAAPKLGFPLPVTIRSFLGRLTAAGVEGIQLDLHPMDLLGGADGNLWLTGGIGLTRVGIDFSAAAFSSGQSFALANGPDRNVWYTGGRTGLATVSTSTGLVTERTLTGEQTPFPSIALFVTTGPDGNVWLTGATFNGDLESPGYWNWIGRYTPSGQFTEYRFPTLTGLPLLGRITAGPDGNVWFTEPGDYDHPGGKIGRIDPNGNVTEFATPTAGSMPSGITTGPDGNIWFTEPAASKVGKLVLCPPTELCLAGARFHVEATFRRPSDPAPLPGNAVSLTPGAGYFWFFDAANIEVVAKVLNGCQLGSSYWFFASGLTNVEVVLTVTDTRADVVKTYTNAQGTPFQPIQDTGAFSTCP